MIDFIEKIVEKINYYRWCVSYERIEDASIIPSGDPILLRIAFDVIVRFIATVIAYAGLAILLSLLIWEIFHDGFDAG